MSHQSFFHRTPDQTVFSVPSYEEVVGSGNYPVRQSNLRQSTSQLPSYEDIIAAVENEGTGPAGGSPTEETPLNDPAPAPVQPPTEPQGEVTERNPSMPARSSSRASRLLRPLRVRRIDLFTQNTLVPLLRGPSARTIWCKRQCSGDLTSRLINSVKGERKWANDLISYANEWHV